MRNDALEPDEVSSSLRPATEMPDDSGLAEQAWPGESAALFAGRIKPLVRTELTVDVTRLGSARCGDWLASLTGPTCLARVSRSSDDSIGFLEISLDLLQPVLDRMLGSNEPTTVERRPLTELEQRLAGRVVQLWTDAFLEAWPGSDPWHLALAEIGSRPRALPKRAELPLVVMCCDVRMRNAAGTIQWAIPQTWLEELAAPADPACQPADATTVELTVELTASEVDASDLANLEPGDIIATDHAPDQPLYVRTSDGREFRAHAGSRQGHKAIRIE